MPKLYRAQCCKKKDCTFIDNSAGRNDIFSKEPASAKSQPSAVKIGDTANSIVTAGN